MSGLNMPDKKPGESKKSYLERCVPKLISEGRDPDQAVAICNSMWAKAQEESTLEVCVEKSIEFEADVAPNGFQMVVIEDSDPIESLTFAQVFAAFGCEADKRYKIEICTEEC